MKQWTVTISLGWACCVQWLWIVLYLYSLRGHIISCCNSIPLSLGSLLFILVSILAYLISLLWAFHSLILKQPKNKDSFSITTFSPLGCWPWLLLKRKSLAIWCRSQRHYRYNASDKLSKMDLILPRMSPEEFFLRYLYSVAVRILIFRSQWDGLVGEGTCCQVWQPKLDP